MSRRAIVIGGGIGGLAAAIGLRQAGFLVEVFERAPELKEVGSGLSLWSNALAALGPAGSAREGPRAGRRGPAGRVPHARRARSCSR